MRFKIVPESPNKWAVKSQSFDEQNTWWHEGIFDTEQQAKKFIDKMLLAEERRIQEKKERELFKKNNPPYIYP